MRKGLSQTAQKEERKKLSKKKNMFHLPSPSNINPPTKSIENLKKKICRELRGWGRFGCARQVIRATSIGWDQRNASVWMNDLLKNPEAISYLREELNRDFASQGWYVTWLQQERCGYTVKMTYSS